MKFSINTNGRNFSKHLSVLILALAFVACSNRQTLSSSSVVKRTTSSDLLESRKADQKFWKDNEEFAEEQAYELYEMPMTDYLDMIVDSISDSSITILDVTVDDPKSIVEEFLQASLANGLEDFGTVGDFFADKDITLDDLVADFTGKGEEKSDSDYIEDQERILDLIDNYSQYRSTYVADSTEMESMSLVQTPTWRNRAKTGIANAANKLGHFVKENGCTLVQKGTDKALDGLSECYKKQAKIASGMQDRFGTAASTPEVSKIAETCLSTGAKVMTAQVVTADSCEKLSTAIE